MWERDWIFITCWEFPKSCSKEDICDALGYRWQGGHLPSLAISLAHGFHKYAFVMH